ncbi:MAG: VWA domain-containing protein [Acidobacteria bacterium]|nr:VWA domain-containing protein [Acidobacteriota bacterium]
MKKNAWLARLLTLSLSLSPLYAQQGSAPRTSPPSPAVEDEVVRITTNLVQLDVVVTDKDGRVVTDLRAEDFEVLEDGRPQAITNLSYIPLEPPPSAAGAAARAPAAKDKNAPPVPAPPRRLRPEQARRTMALVAGHLSYGSMDAVHDALKKYVDEQVQPDDLVAIIPLSGSSGALQQFTTDRRQLARAVERVRWWPASGYDVDAVETARRDETNKITRGGVGVFESAEARATREHIDNTIGPACRRRAR